MKNCSKCGGAVRRLRWWEQIAVNPLVIPLYRGIAKATNQPDLPVVHLEGYNSECNGLIRFE